MNEGYSELDLCPICMNISVVTWQDENERSHSHCRRCGWNSDADGTREMAEQDRQDCANEAESGIELERDTPFGEELDGGASQEPYDGGGWPGDGSGTDDLADYNANEADDYRNEGFGGDE